ncbi:MAG TPA: rhomboid family intramembrane serine protease, partial [Burkholderiales bacterium]|nr:rhomboid family intramembrane serine protease [Burkholderiales bacterium]
MFAIPPTIQALIIINVVVYLLQLATGDALLIPFALWSSFGSGGSPGMPMEVPPFEPWQPITYSFLHGGTTHLFFNMLALWMFGTDIERVWGPRRFLIYYFVCVVSAAAAQLLVAQMSSGPAYPTIGASGGVFGVLLAFGMMFPRRMVMLLFPPIPMPAWLLVTLYGGLELLLGVTGTQAGVAHFAHLGGMAGGYLLIQYWRGRLPIRPGRR